MGPGAGRNRQGGLALARSLGAVGEDFDLLERDQAVGNHRVELRQHPAKAILLVDDLDQDR